MTQPTPVENYATDIAQIAQSRHTAKAYTGKALSETEIQALLSLLRFSASSVNSQPWHFIVATTPEGRDAVAKAGTDENYSFNSDNIRKAGMVVVFAARQDADEDYLKRLLDSEEADGRFPEEKNRQEMEEIRRFFIDSNRNEDGDAHDWMARQVYWNGGQFLLGAAAMGLDATPMEGIDRNGLDAAFSLPEKGYTNLFAVTVGRNDDETDWNYGLPKSRLPEAEIVTRL
jgi:nitroreductase/dihydropteridine reductase